MHMFLRVSVYRPIIKNIYCVSRLQMTFIDNMKQMKKLIVTFIVITEVLEKKQVIY